MDWKFIVLAAVLAAIAAVFAYRFAQSKTNAAVIAAEAKIDEANRSAERIVSEATRNAENAKKEAVLSAKEEILQLKANSEAEEKKRKQELQGIENRIMQREETLDKRSDSLDKREHQLSSLAGTLLREFATVELHLCTVNLHLRYFDVGKAVVNGLIVTNGSHVELGDGVVLTHGELQRAARQYWRIVSYFQYPIEKLHYRRLHHR